MTRFPVVTVRSLAPILGVLGRSRHEAFVLGSGHRADILVPYASLASSHLRFEWKHGDLSVRYLVSDPGERGGGRAWSGDQLSVADLRVQLEFGPEPGPAAAPGTLSSRLLASGMGNVQEALREARTAAGPETIDALLTVAGTPLSREAEQILEGLVIRVGSEAVPFLQRGLLNHARAGRAVAARLLASLGLERDETSLRAALHDRDSWTRAAAVDDLHRVADPATRKLLHEALDDREGRVVTSALGVLGSRGPDPRLIERLPGLLRDGRLRVRLAALETIANLEAAASLASDLEHCLAHDAEPEPRAEALRLLAGLGAVTRERAVTRALEDNDPFVRQEAVDLATDPEPAYRSVAADSRNDLSREAAVSAMAGHGSPEDLRVLLAVVPERNRRLAAAARRSLARRPLRFGRAALEAAWADPRTLPVQRRLLLQILSTPVHSPVLIKVDHERIGFDLLFRALADPHPGVRRFGRRRLRALITWSEIRPASVWDDETRDEGLEVGLSGAELAVFATAATRVSGPGLTELLAEAVALGGGLPFVSELAARRGAELLPTQASLADPDLWRERLGSPRAEERRSAAAVYGWFELPGAKDALVPLLTDPHVAVVAVAAKWLAQLGPPPEETALSALDRLTRSGTPSGTTGHRTWTTALRGIASMLARNGGARSLQQLAAQAGHPAAAEAIRALADRLGPALAVPPLADALAAVPERDSATAAAILETLDALDSPEGAPSVRARLSSLPIWNEYDPALPLSMLARWDDVASLEAIVSFAERCARRDLVAPSTVSAADEALGQLITLHPSPPDSVLERALALGPIRAMTPSTVMADVISREDVTYEWAHAAARRRVATPTGVGPRGTLAEDELFGQWRLETLGETRADDHLPSCLLALEGDGSLRLEVIGKGPVAPRRESGRWSRYGDFVFVESGDPSGIVRMARARGGHSGRPMLSLHPDPWLVVPGQRGRTTSQWLRQEPTVPRADAARFEDRIGAGVTPLDALDPKAVLALAAADRAAVFLIDTTRRELLPVWRAGQAEVPVLSMDDASLVAQAARTRRPITLDDAGHGYEQAVWTPQMRWWPDRSEWLKDPQDERRFRATRVLVLPLEHSRGVLGVLELAGSSPETFTDVDIGRAVKFADRLASALSPAARKS